jgi:hypothetical protein
LFLNIFNVHIISVFLIWFIYFVYHLGIAHNVPAVYDVLPARIRACAARPGLAKCGGVRRRNGAQRNDLAERSPSRPKGGEAYTGLLGAVPSFYLFLLFSSSFSFFPIGRTLLILFYFHFFLLQTFLKCPLFVLWKQILFGLAF